MFGFIETEVAEAAGSGDLGPAWPLFRTGSPLCKAVVVTDPSGAPAAQAECANSCRTTPTQVPPAFDSRPQVLLWCSAP